MTNYWLRVATWLRAAAGVSVAVIAWTSVTRAQDTWTTLAPVPAPTEGMTVGGVGHVIIAAYGFDGNTASDTNLTRLYNISTNSWTFGAAAPLPARSEAAYGKTTHGRFLYVAGGVKDENFAPGSGTVLNNLEKYDSVNNSWTTLAPMPTARAGAAAAVIEDAIYVIGGRTSGSYPCSSSPRTAVVERYDIDSDTWSTKMTLPSPRSDMAAVAHEGKIYVFGGCSGVDAATSEVDVYDPETNTWSTGLASMPTPRASLVAGQLGENLYAISGCSGCFFTSPVNANEEYNIESNSWSNALPIPTARAEAGAHSRGDRIYVLGGFDTSLSPTTANEVFKHREHDEDEGEGHSDDSSRDNSNNPKAAYGTATKLLPVSARIWRSKAALQLGTSSLAYGTDMQFNNSASHPETSSLEYTDPSQNIYLQSVGPARSIAYNGPCVTFAGDALLSDIPGYAFTFTSCDLSLLVTEIGDFAIGITGPSGFLYQKSAFLTSGFVHIHSLLSLLGGPLL